MKTTVSEEGPTRRKLEVEVPAEEVAKLYDQAIRRLSGEVKIPGFRPGKAPRAIVESRIGKDAIRDEVLRDAVPSFYSRAAREESLKPITNPEIEVTGFEEGEPLTFTATVEVRPEFSLPDVKGVRAARPAWSATDEEIAAQLDRLREQFGTLEEVSRNAVSGDFVTIDIFATRHGEKVEGVDAQDLVYEVGSGGFVKGLDEELEGKRAGDILKFNAALPAGAAQTPAPSGLIVPEAAKRADEEATFQVVVKQVQAKRLPPIDDEFAKLASEFDTLEELKQELKSRIEQVKKERADAMVRHSLLDALVEEVDPPLPEAMVESELQSRLTRLLNELERGGLSFEQYLEAAGTTKEELVEETRTASRLSVAGELVLDAVAEAEGLKVTREDIAQEIAVFAAQTGTQPEEMAKSFADPSRVNMLAGDILRRKALSFLVEHAVITEEEGPGQQPDGPDPAETQEL